MKLEAQVAETPPPALIQPGRPRSAIGWEVARLLRDHGDRLVDGDVVTVQKLSMPERQSLRSCLDAAVRKRWPDMRLTVYQTTDERIAIMLVKKQGKS